MTLLFGKIMENKNFFYKYNVYIMTLITPFIFCGILFLTNSFIDKLALDFSLPVSCWSYTLLSLLGAAVGFLATKFSNKVGPIDNWNTLRIFSLTPYFEWLILLFLFTPVLLKTTNNIDKDFDISLDFFRLWALGFCIYLYIFSYKLLRPKIFEYADFSDFLKKEGSFITLRNDARELLNDIERRKKEGKMLDVELHNLESDIATLNSISLGYDTNHKAKEYGVMKYRSSIGFSLPRAFLFTLTIPPILLLISIFFSNFNIASSAAIDSLCHEITMKNTKPNLPERCKKTQ